MRITDIMVAAVPVVAVAAVSSSVLFPDNMALKNQMLFLYFSYALVMILWTGRQLGRRHTEYKKRALLCGFMLLLPFIAIPYVYMKYVRHNKGSNTVPEDTARKFADPQH